MMTEFPGDSTLPVAAPAAYQLWVDSMSVSTKMRLASADPTKVTVYPFVCRRDIPASESSLATIFQDDLVTEQKNEASVGLTASVLGVTPYQSPRLCSYLKFGKPFTRTLTPAHIGQGTDTMTLASHIRNKSVSRYRVMLNTGASTHIGLAGITRGFAVRIHGVPMNDNTGAAGPVAPLIGTTASAIDVVGMRRFRIRIPGETMPRYGYVGSLTAAASVHVSDGTTAQQAWINGWTNYPLS